MLELKLIDVSKDPDVKWLNATWAIPMIGLLIGQYHGC